MSRLLADTAVGPLAPLATVVLPHGLRDADDQPIVPQIVWPDRATPIVVTAVDNLNVAYQNADTVNFQVANFRAEFYHSFLTTPLPTLRWNGNPVTGGGGGGGPTTANYIATVGVVAGDVVCLSAADTVAKADADDATTQPVIGIVQTVIAGIATVQYNGDLPGFVGLVTGATYFLSATPGLFTTVPPAGPPGAIVQRLGFARNATTFVIEVDRDWTVLS